LQANDDEISLLTTQEALIYAMIAVAASDRTISREELARIGTMVRELPALSNVEETWLSHEAQNCGMVLKRPDGVASVIRMIALTLDQPLRETAYALAAEVAASDLAIKDDERNFLALLANGLEIDPLLRVALERAAQVRHRSA
jgi:uncharacterized membrane protein YebE (DUF533 family)